jgi:hypothetical protein
VSSAVETDNEKEGVVNTRRIHVILSFALGGAVAAAAAVALAQTTDEVLLIEQSVDHDVYAAHPEVNIRAAIDGDLVAAGQRITVDGNVTGDIIVAAQDIEIRSEVA